MNDTAIHPVVARFVEDHGLESVEGVFAYDAGQDLAKPGLGGRRRTRLTVRDEENRCWELFLKRYGRPSWLRRLGRLLTGRRSWCEARREFENARILRRIGLPAARPIVWGAEPGLFAVRRSYVIVSGVPGDALERVGEAFVQRHISSPRVLEELTDQLAERVRRLHEAGLVHRDLYASHIFLHDNEGRIELYLIDLARVFRPRWRRFRWRVKDLAQLKYSMPWLWVKLYWERFLWDYLPADDESQRRRWLRAIDVKVGRMVRRIERRNRRAPKEVACESH